MKNAKKVDTYKSQKNNQIDTYRYKNLIKEEISDIRDKYLTPKDCDIYTFAEAILRKAQEK